MNPQNQECTFESAVGQFSEEQPISVTPDKLRSYLDATAGMEESPARRLRELAIRLENKSFVQGWRGLAAIYEAAAEADPADDFVLHSWGISATGWLAEFMTPDRAEREAIAGEAERVLGTALKLAPSSSDVARAFGMLFYNHPSRAEDRGRYRSSAIEWFSRAVEWDPRNIMAQLYLAHCFHDAKDLPRAILEYEKVDLDQLTRDLPAWRAIKCQEQLALCYAESGNKAEAVRRFANFLDAAESWDSEKLSDSMFNVDELVAAVTEFLEDQELRRRTTNLVRRLEIEDWYPELART